MLALQVLLFGAIAPVAILMYWTMRRDRFPEPPKVVLLTMVFGALAVVPIAITQLVLSFLLGVSLPPSDLRGVLLVSFLVAALVEEIAKWMVLEGYSARHSAFDEPYDGIVYGVAASLGFALIENLMYVGLSGLSGFGPAAVTAVGRAFLAVPLHACCGAVLGTCIGVARFCRTREASIGWRALGIIGAIGLHGVYDVFAFLGAAEDVSESIRVLAPLGLLVSVAFGFVAVGLAAARLRRDQVVHAALAESREAGHAAVESEQPGLLRQDAAAEHPPTIVSEVVRAAVLRHGEPGRIGTPASGVPALPLTALIAAGLSSFALVAGLAMMVVGGFTEESDGTGTTASDALVGLGGLAFLAGVFGDAIALVLSVLAVVFDRRWRAASVVAAIATGLPLAGSVAILILGILSAGGV